MSALNMTTFKNRLYSFSPSAHLDPLMKSMEAKSRTGFGWKARVLNFAVLGLDFSGFFLNALATPALIAVQPLSMAAYGAAWAGNRVICASKIDKPEGAYRRKLSRGLQQIMRALPNPQNLGKVVLNVVKFATAFFASLCVGFVSLKASLWIHHRLGLICLPRLAKKDREESILKTAQKREGRSLVHAFQAQSALNKTHIQKKLRKDFLLKEGLLPKAIEEATNKKRVTAKIQIQAQLGREFNPQEWQQMQDFFWRKLSDPFTFSQKSPHEFQELLKNPPSEITTFLNKYFKWKIDGASPQVLKQPFAFKSTKHYEEYLLKYYEWNLTPEEALKYAKAIELNQEQRHRLEKSVQDEMHKKIARIHQHGIKKELQSEAFFQRLMGLMKPEMTFEQKNTVEKRLKKIMALENSFLKTFRKNKELTDQQIHDLMKSVSGSFSKEELEALHAFAKACSHQVEQTDLKTERELKKRLESSKNSQFLYPHSHYYQLKKKVLQHLVLMTPQDLRPLSPSILDLEKSREKALKILLDAFYIKGGDGQVLRREEIETYAFRLTNTQNISIDKNYWLKQQSEPLEDVKTKYAWTSVTLRFSKKDPDVPEKIIFSKPASKGNNPYTPLQEYFNKKIGKPQHEWSWNELEQESKKRQKVFLDAAKNSHLNRERRQNTYLFDQICPVRIQGVYGQVAEQQAKHFSVQEEKDNRLWQSVMQSYEDLQDENEKLLTRIKELESQKQALKN
ncbi:MAG: hypothetical protein BGO14_11610 [Chlamydiales bacterium 38-26]|nr:hypothetical protein [Chlamydiales bacterium]OJV11587.1 MAG: hypothetical protein BGO14_11610 [Chlamydiales bacterium 38-26]